MARNIMRMSATAIAAGFCLLTDPSVLAQDAVFVNTSGDVGIGTNTPSNKLHVSGSSGTTKAFIQETSSTTAAREILELQNNGLVAWILEDTSVPERWANSASVNFVINNQANGGIEYTFGPTGNFTAAGTITPGSSRTIKEGFSAIDPQELLRGVLELPITSWSYKRDPGVRHIGPMSEDFHAAFAIGGDDQGISVTDSAGIALAAIQGLHRLVSEKDAQIAELQQQLDELRQQVERLAGGE